MIKGQNKDAQDKKGLTPLHVAVEKGKLDVAELLIDEGAKCCVKDRFGRTPFGRTMLPNSIASNEMIRLLVQKQPGILDNFYHKGTKKALDLAIKHRDIEKFNLLLVYGANSTKEKKTGLISKVSKFFKFSRSRDKFDENIDKFNKLDKFANYFSKLDAQSKINQACSFDKYEKPVQEAINIVADKFIEVIVDRVKKIKDQEGSNKTNCGNVKNRSNAIMDAVCSFLKSPGVSEKGSLLSSLILCNFNYNKDFRQKLFKEIEKSAETKICNEALRFLFDRKNFASEVNAFSRKASNEKPAVKNENVANMHIFTNFSNVGKKGDSLGKNNKCAIPTEHDDSVMLSPQPKRVEHHGQGNIPGSNGMRPRKSFVSFITTRPQDSGRAY